MYVCDGTNPALNPIQDGTLLGYFEKVLLNEKKKIERKKEKETVVIANCWFTGLFHGIQSLHSMVRSFHLIVILLHNMVRTFHESLSHEQKQGRYSCVYLVL